MPLDWAHVPDPPGVKICGLMTIDEALACVAAGAELIGLNFHPASPRCLDAEAARAIIAALDRPSRAVGVFVDRPPAEIAELAGSIGLSVVQLHGSEPPADLVALRELALIRAFRIGTPDDVQAVAAYLDEARSLGRPPDAILVDAFVPGMAGGTGASIAPDLLASLPVYPRLILAGGLNPDNVALRVRLVRPWMVDVASGVESSPGRKDMRKVRAFIAASRLGGGL